MTVNELISKLQRYNGNKEVCFINGSLIGKIQDCKCNYDIFPIGEPGINGITGEKGERDEVPYLVAKIESLNGII